MGFIWIVFVLIEENSGVVWCVFSGIMDCVIVFVVSVRNGISVFCVKILLV